MSIRSFPYCSQYDSRDCGAACLQMIAKFYGKNYRLQTLRDYSFITREGASLMGVSDAAEKIGFRTSGVRVPLDVLREKIPLPCILHWNQKHYVVCYRIRKKKKGYVYHIADPATSLQVFDDKEFKNHWYSSRCNAEDCGIALALSPDTTFYNLDDDEKSIGGYKLRYFFRYLYPYKWQITESVIGMVLFMVLGLIFPFLTQSLVDTGIGDRNFSYVVLVLIAQFVLSFTSMSVGYLQSWISLHVNTRVNIALVSDFWRKLMKLPLHFFDTKMTGDLMRRLGDHGRIEGFLLGDSINIIFAIVNFVIYGVLLGYYNLMILFIFLSGHLLYAVWISFFLHYRKQIDYKSFEIQSKNNSCVIQLIQGMQEIKLNNEERRRRWEWEQIQAKSFNVGIKSLKINQIQGFGAGLLNKTTDIIITLIVAKQVIDGGMTLGMMMALTYIIGQVNAPVSQFIGFINAFQNAKISLERLNEVHSKEDEDSHLGELRSELPQKGSISIQNLNFSYSGSTRDYVLKGINLEIPQYKMTAIVGMSGSGKTTLMKLLQGFYLPQEGSIKVGNIPLSAINPHLWRSKMGAVMQDGYIFSDTIARNIAVGGDEIDKKKVREAARMANIEDFIDELPLGFNTKIGMEGNGISQGQKQRILIARAIYKNPDYLFFDEATNALDSRNENEIWKNLSVFYRNRTVVVCAHRLSTVRHADQIIVLKDGRVIETGTHDNLMEAHGEYFHLVRNQMEKIG